MNVELFSVYDSAAQRYLDPFCAPTAEVAMRGFRQAVNKDGHPFNLYPSDYVLFHVGTFIPEEGRVLEVIPHSLGNGVTFVDGNEFNVQLEVSDADPARA